MHKRPKAIKSHILYQTAHFFSGAHLFQKKQDKKFNESFHLILILLAIMVEDQLDNSIIKYECIS